jgi:hypothetical protein
MSAESVQTPIETLVIGMLASNLPSRVKDLRGWRRVRENSPGKNVPRDLRITQPEGELIELASGFDPEATPRAEGER